MSYLSALRVSLNEKLLQLEESLESNLPHLLDASPYSFLDDAEILPPKLVFDLLEKIRVDLKAVDSMITPTRFKLVEMGMLHYKCAALNTAVVLNVAQAIESFGGEAQLCDLAMKCDVNEHKLGRILRTLTGEFVFVECSPDRFKNSRHSIALLSPGARSFISFITDLGMKCANGIPGDMVNPDTKHSFSDRTAPFCKMVSKNDQTFAEYMGDPKNAEMVALGNEGIVGWLNGLTRASLINDYPWEALGDAKVIDLGCGMGDSGIDVLKKFPRLSWVYQDLPSVIDNLKENFPDQLQPRVRDGQISFVVQDYFQSNVSDGDVWYMRGVLHEYDDNEALEVLKHLAVAMRRTPNSIMIINEVLNCSPFILPETSIAPPSEHIPSDQSCLPSTGNTMTWSTFSLFGGKERSLEEYEGLLNSAGFTVSKLYRFRTFTVMLECVLSSQSK
ncbi:S-adenosyl-L-methionine-dependent methyltransferase [Clohesyomyces aquaticus]|uniref:S-adenosyl-L-methionine-dependent methyltransferase n=1 Tax=Clohesyomyces aquaticus TaxID=1231657 RepID=A0A1Y1Z0D8_9PLEO|nr:S-adenosyl-L-methionine-dependent methyltransferase [Clohesyomyces aquaticus]